MNKIGFYLFTIILVIFCATFCGTMKPDPDFYTPEFSNDFNQVLDTLPPKSNDSLKMFYSIANAERSEVIMNLRKLSGNTSTQVSFLSVMDSSGREVAFLDTSLIWHVIDTAAAKRVFKEQYVWP